MEYKKKGLIGIIVGLEREKKIIPKNNNIIVKNAYGKNSYHAANKLIKQNVDFLVSFGFAKSIKKNIKNSEIIIPKKIFNSKGKFLETSKKHNEFFKKKIHFKTILSNNISTINRIMNKSESVKGQDIGAVDMESFYVSKAASENNVEFSCVRVIFDDNDTIIPKFLSESIDKEGKIKFFFLIYKVMVLPIRILELYRLSRQYTKSKKVITQIAKSIF